ncbi:MAG: APC family permease [Trueperaceae bacterium]|nr:APC family permease [Trueperaceae bacterium]
MMAEDSEATGRLRREVGTFGAVMMGLGSIVGTGVFVSIGVAAGIAGPSVVLAIAIGAMVATFNGLSSAQLAAAHPVSGGTYEYGYRFLTPRFGFTAGWTFLLAKSASAATAALGFAGYVLGAFGVAARAPLVPLAVVLIAALTAVVLAGIRRSNATNIAIVTITLASLAFFVLAGLPSLVERGGAAFVPFFDPEPGRGGLPALLYASALMFVAYTGYGRIATLGEEVRDPARTIPRAVVAALLVVMALYAAVALVGVGTAGTDALSAVEARTAPLETAARGFGVPFAPQVLAIGAVTAMVGVLLNLILGLSRVLLAMGRRRDVPAMFGRVNEAGTTPVPAVVAVGLLIAGLALLGDVRVTWSFSAFTVLVYYAITNLAALRLPPEMRRFPRWVSIAGLASCLTLAFFVDPPVLIVGTGLLAAGLVWHEAARRVRG